MGLIIGLVRKVPQADRFVRNSDWLDGEFSVTKRVTGLRLGLLGFGALGQSIAKRAQGFNMRVSYFDKAPVSGFEESWVAQPKTLAEQVDVLVVCIPSTQGDVSANSSSEVIVDQSVLDALGSKGYVVNVTQSQLVDQTALIKALQTKKIAGAALDVFASEPNIAAEFKSLQNVVLTPHMGSVTEEARRFMAQLAVANLQSHFTQGTLLTPIPQMALLAPP
jgi:lactate dehydrogenase-like 2-hydroxyacid dehydrogenase